MSAASNFLEIKVLEHVLNGVAYTPPIDVFLALFTDTAGTIGTSGRLEDGIITDEVSGGGYVRRNIDVDGITGAFTVSVDGTGQATTKQTITFPTAVGTNWGTITHVAVMDLETAGEVLFYGAVTTPKLIEVNDIFQTTAGNLTITLA